jgi:hypothetical protein
MVHTSTDRRSHRAHRRNSRCSNSEQEQTQERTALPARNGFLNHVFSPVRVANRELSQEVKVEGEFYNSLHHLANLYGFEPFIPAGQVYPYNILLSFRHAKKCMAEIDKQLEVQIIQDKRHKACLATSQNLSIGHQLYYVPVKPLWILLQDKDNKAAAQLVLSLFANLYRRGVAHQSEEGSFLCYQYEMLGQWLTDCADEYEQEEYLPMLSDHYAQAWYGKRLFRQICHPYSAAQFAQRVGSFQPRTEWETELSQVCAQFSLLFQQCPNAHYYQHLYPDLLEETEGDYTMHPDNYLSFYWTDEDSNTESLMANINATLNECSTIVEPMTIQLFDRPQAQQAQDCYFEWRFLLLTDYLCEILFDLP